MELFFVDDPPVKTQAEGGAGRSIDPRRVPVATGEEYGVPRRDLVEIRNGASTPPPRPHPRSGPARANRRRDLRHDVRIRRSVAEVEIGKIGSPGREVRVSVAEPSGTRV